MKRGEKLGVAKVVYENKDGNISSSFGLKAIPSFVAKVVYENKDGNIKYRGTVEHIATKVAKVVYENKDGNNQKPPSGFPIPSPLNYGLAVFAKQK